MTGDRRERIRAVVENHPDADVGELLPKLAHLEVYPVEDPDRVADTVATVRNEGVPHRVKRVLGNVGPYQLGSLVE